MQQYTNDIICYANERVSVRVRFPYKWNGEIGSHGKYYHKSLMVYNISWDGSRGSSQGSLP